MFHVYTTLGPFVVLIVLILTLTSSDSKEWDSERGKTAYFKGLNSALSPAKRAMVGGRCLVLLACGHRRPLYAPHQPMPSEWEQACKLRSLCPSILLSPHSPPSPHMESILFITSHVHLSHLSIASTHSHLFHLSYSDAQLGVSQHPECPLRVWRRSYPCLYLSLFCDFAFCLDKNGPDLTFPVKASLAPTFFPPLPSTQGWLLSAS